MSGDLRFYFKPGENEFIQTVVHIKPDIRSAVLGHVRDAAEKPVSGALVMLFRGGAQEQALLTQAFTDDDGMFYFGPLEPGKLHLIKIYKDSVRLRELEIKTE